MINLFSFDFGVRKFSTLSRDEFIDGRIGFMLLFDGCVEVPGADFSK